MSKTDGLVKQARHWSHSAMEEGHENEGYLLARFADTIEQQSATLAAEQEAKRVMATELREARRERDHALENEDRERTEHDELRQDLIERLWKTEAKLAASEAARERLAGAIKEARTFIERHVDEHYIGTWTIMTKLETALASPPAPSEDKFKTKLAVSEAERERAHEHLGNVLFFLCDLHPDDRCEAFDKAVTFYNDAHPDKKIEPSGLPLQNLRCPEFEHAALASPPAQAGAGEAMFENGKHETVVSEYFIPAPARDAVLEEAAQAVDAMRWSSGEYDAAAVAAACCARIRALSSTNG